MTNIDLIRFKANGDKFGYLTAIEGQKDIDFDIKRVYYIYNVDALQRRGFHSHKDLKQVLICLNGSVDILVKTPFEQQTVHLNSPSEGLYIGEMVWREMFNFSEGSVLLVLASKNYDEKDYIRTYDTYETEAKKYFGGSKI